MKKNTNEIKHLEALIRLTVRARESSPKGSGVYDLFLAQEKRLKESLRKAKGAKK